MKSVLALDQGTTGSTAMLMAEDGRILGRGYREIRQHFPEPGWVEHDPEEILEATLTAARDAIGRERPAAIGITNQRETVVVWERNGGRPIQRAIVWQDRRTADRCRALRAERGDAWLGERTGLVWDPYFSATKIEWLLKRHAGLARRMSNGEVAVGTIDSWLAFRLTGTHVTDHTNASRTLLYDIRRRAWDPELLGLFGVPAEAMPALVPSSGVVGSTPASLFGAEIPVAGIAGDQQSALFGQGCYAPGDAKNTYGTGAFLLMVVGNERAGGRAGRRADVLTTIACDARGQPILAVEGSIFVAGAAVQWLRDGLGLVGNARETEAMARSVPDTGGVYFVPALVGLGAPYWDPGARGTIVGLTRGTTRAHLVRAALEAMAFSTRDVADAMREATGVTLNGLKVDGGAAANDWLMDFQARVLGVPVRRPDVVETTALGAAGLAGLAVGVWPDAAAFSATRQYRTFPPGPAPADEYRQWRRAVDTTLHWSRLGG